MFNVIYKTWSGCIVSRIKNVLNKIISNDQTGFLFGSYIAGNNLLIYDLMNYLEKNYIPGALVMIDFKRAFHSEAWKFIQNTLNHFNVSPFICNWIFKKLCNAVFCVSQTGIWSNIYQLGVAVDKVMQYRQIFFLITCGNVVN